MMKTESAASRDLLQCLHAWYRPLRDRLGECRGRTVIQEHTEAVPECQCDERFLQILWNEQRLGPNPRTVSGESLEVVSPGTWNVSAGPDFQQAVIRLNGITHRGAVEVHREAADWFRHGHDRDSAYENVILHVVWRDTDTAMRPALPCLELSRHVRRPLRELMNELSAATYPYGRQVAPGACAVRWAMTDDETVGRILRTAGLSRFEDKTTSLGRRTVAEGPDQALYEAVFEALGYRVNREAFRRLALAAPIAVLRTIPEAEEREALLFGMGGLLPDPSVTAVLPAWKPRLARLWDIWWRMGRTPAELSWRRSGCRPINSPERRLAAGIEWLHGCDLAPEAWLRNIAAAATGPRDLLRSLRRACLVESDWEAARTWEAALRQPVRLLGAARIDDIVVNVLLPFLHSVGMRCGDESLSTLARETYLCVGPLQSNRRIIEASHRFLVPPSRLRSLVRGACAQQGLLELYRCFCGVLHGDCANCPFTSMKPFEDFPSRQ